MPSFTTPPSLPLTLPLRYSAWMSILILGMASLFLWSGFAPDSSFHDQGRFTLFLLKRVAPLVGLIALYLWVSLNVLGRGYLRLSKEKLEYRHTFGRKEAAWQDVVDVRTYSYKGREMIGIVTRQSSRGEGGFLQSVSSVHGVSDAITIPKSLVHTIPFDELAQICQYLRRESQRTS